MPPMNADERTTLERWLDFYRATLAAKCDGLSDEQLRTASVPPSELTLLGLLQAPFDEHPAHEAAYAGFPPDWAAQIEISCSS